MNIEHNAVEALFLEQPKRILDPRCRRGMNVAVADQAQELFASLVIWLDDQQFLYRSFDETANRRQTDRRSFLWFGAACSTVPTAPMRAGPFAIVFRRDDVDRNVACAEILLQPPQHAPTVDIRQANIERDRAKSDTPWPATAQRRRGRSRYL